MKALHEHDCDACELLGVAQGRDFYVCPVSDSIAIRSSSIEQDYQSFPVFIARDVAQSSLLFRLAISMLDVRDDDRKAQVELDAENEGRPDFSDDPDAELAHEEFMEEDREGRIQAERYESHRREF